MDQRIRLQRLGDEPVELSMPEDTSLKDDGKGMVEGRFKSKSIIWFNSLTGVAAWNPEFVSVVQPFVPTFDAPDGKETPDSPPATIAFPGTQAAAPKPPSPPKPPAA